MTTHTILALGLLSTMTLATPVKPCSKLACSELAKAERLDFSVTRKFDGSPSGCVRYENGEDVGMLWVSNPDLNFRTTNCDGCKVMDSECAAEADDGGCDAHATKKGTWCVCQPGFRMNRGDNGKPLGGWNQQYHWNARNADGVKCVPDEEYMSSYLATTCSLEGGSCACEGTVLYGRGGGISALLDDDYAVKTDVTGNVRCNNDEFGDPLFLVKKRCICITGKRCDPNATKKGNWCECNEHYRMNRNSNGKPYGGLNNRYHFNGVGASVNICVPDPNNPPSKYVKGDTGGNSCPFGYRYIEERSECLEAGKELGVGITGRAPAGSWGWVPPYCSWQSGGDQAVHFNSKISGNNDGGYTPICELDWELPTEVPTSSPTPAPTTSPTSAPSATSTISPSSSPTKAPTSSPTSAPTNLPLDSRCFDKGSTVQERDDACAGDLVCARAGYDGRHYGGCHTKGDELKAGPGVFGIINHCCSKVPDDTFKADGEKCIGGTSLISTCYKCKNQAYFWYGKLSYVCGQEEPKWENGTRCLAASCNRCKNKAKWVWNKFSFVCGGQSGSG